MDKHSHFAKINRLTI